MQLEIFMGAQAPMAAMLPTPLKRVQPSNTAWVKKSYKIKGGGHAMMLMIINFINAQRPLFKIIIVYIVRVLEWTLLCLRVICY